MKNNNIKKSKLSNFKNKLDFWATNSEEGGWNISSTDEGSQKMLENENEKQIKIQTGTEVVDDFVVHGFIIHLGGHLFVVLTNVFVS